MYVNKLYYSRCSKCFYDNYNLHLFTYIQKSLKTPSAQSNYAKRFAWWSLGVFLIIFDDLPMPPSSNHRMIPVNGRLIKSQDIRDYDKQIQLWMLRKMSKLSSIRREIKQWIDEGKYLKVTINLRWPKEKLISKDGKPKKNDLDNRLKTLLDSLSEIIYVDDKYIINISATKISWMKNYPEVSVKIESIDWVHLELRE